MSSRRSCILAAAVLTAGAAPLAGEPAGKAPAQPPVDAVKVNQAVDKAVRYLLDQAKGNALPIQSPPHASNLSTHELVFYTLVHGGADPNQPDVQAMLKYLLDKKLERTYCVSLLAMGLHAFDRHKYQWRIAECADFLANNQCANGQWSYGTPAQTESRRPAREIDTRVKPTPAGGGDARAGRPLGRIPITVRRRGPPAGDNSNSKIAALGFRACAEAGCLVDARVYEDALKWWLGCQGMDGGWAYGGTGARRAYGTMTAGGVASVAIYRYLLGRRAPPQDKDIAAGLRWLDAHFTLERNPMDTQDPMPRGEHLQYHYYFLYSLERVGTLCGTEYLGSHLWYKEGVEHILQQQRPDGSWAGEVGHPLTDTCYAVLFLRRATKALPKSAPAYTK